MADQDDVPPDDAVYDGREPDEGPPSPPQFENVPTPGRDVQTVELELVEDPRDQIAENYKAKRDQDAADTVRTITGSIQAQQEQNQDEPPPPGPGNEATPASPRYRVNIYGEQYDVPVEDLIRNFQINSAAEANMQAANARLAEANRLLAMAQNAPTNGNGGAYPQHAPEPQPRHEAPTKQAAPNDDDELRQFVETMQLGSTDEAVEAARKLLSKTAAPQQPVDISGQVERVIAIKSDDTRSTAAMTGFFKAFPVLDDPIALGALNEASRIEMAKDLATTGLPLDDILSLDQPQIVKYHRLARIQGRAGFRAPEEILGTVASNPRFRELAMSSPGSQVRVNVDRSSRKQMVQQQPALRSAPQRMQAQTRTAPPLEQRNSDIVAEMRKSRGQVGMGAT